MAGASTGVFHTACPLQTTRASRHPDGARGTYRLDPVAPNDDDRVAQRLGVGTVDDGGAAEYQWPLSGDGTRRARQDGKGQPSNLR